MEINTYSAYTINANNDISAKADQDKAIAVLNNIENCKTIMQIKNLLNEELGITKYSSVYKIGTFANINTVDTDKYFEVSIHYSNETHTCIFPKINKEELDND